MQEDGWMGLGAGMELGLSSQSSQPVPQRTALKAGALLLKRQGRDETGVKTTNKGRAVSLAVRKQLVKSWREWTRLYCKTNVLKYTDLNKNLESRKEKISALVLTSLYHFWNIFLWLLLFLWKVFCFILDTDTVNIPDTPFGTLPFSGNINIGAFFML